MTQEALRKYLKDIFHPAVDQLDVAMGIINKHVAEVIGEDYPRPIDNPEPDDSMRWAVNQEKYEQHKRAGLVKEDSGKSS